MPDYERFGKWIMDVFFEADFLGIDIEGDDVQEMAHSCGLLKKVAVTEPCGEFCACADYDAIPGECYRKNYE